MAGLSDSKPGWGTLHSVIQNISTYICTELCCVGQGGAERTVLGTELCCVGLDGSRGGAERKGLGTELCCFGWGGVGWQ